MENGYNIHKFRLENDWEGRVEATLISKTAAPMPSAAVLYLHGFNDYFFQDHLADWALAEGYNFYALDLRKYGRSILPHQQPNMFRDISEYYEELDLAVAHIRATEIEKIYLIAHSTGGLIAANYLHDRRKANPVNALVLNSPYLENNANFLARKLGMPLLSAIGKIFPDKFTGISLQDGYAKSLHVSEFGEWDFNLAWKPIQSFPLTFGWMRGLHKAQKRVHRGLEIPCPVMVLFSDKSIPPGKFVKAMHTADAVLNVKHIEKYADRLGINVKKIAINQGRHDLALSLNRPRQDYFKALSGFLKNL